MSTSKGDATLFSVVRRFEHGIGQQMLSYELLIDSVLAFDRSLDQGMGGELVDHPWESL